LDEGLAYRLYQERRQAQKEEDEDKGEKIAQEIVDRAKDETLNENRASLLVRIDELQTHTVKQLLFRLLYKH